MHLGLQKVYIRIERYYEIFQISSPAVQIGFISNLWQLCLPDFRLPLFRPHIIALFEQIDNRGASKFYQLKSFNLTFSIYSGNSKLCCSMCSNKNWIVPDVDEDLFKYLLPWLLNSLTSGSDQPTSARWISQEIYNFTSNSSWALSNWL